MQVECSRECVLQGVVTTAPRKVGKSSNRREWMKECLKLLESLMQMPDSKPFREPVDCLKYPVGIPV